MHLSFATIFQPFANWNQLEIRNRVTRSFHWNENWWLSFSPSWLPNLVKGTRWVSLRICVIQTDYICQNLRFVYKIGLCCRKSLKIGVERQRQDNVQTGDKVQLKQTLIPPSPPTPRKKKHKHKQRRAGWQTLWTFAFLYKLDFLYTSQHSFSNGSKVTFTD